MCNKIKWSTISINTALIIIIAYASSGLYTLIDVSTLMSIQPYDDRNETIFWPIAASPTTIALEWISVCVYLSIVLLVIILLCGIQLNKPWLLFVWSILMIFMILADGIVTILSLRQHQLQTYRPSKQVKILFILMITRLIISLCGIFITVFHFRQLNTARSEYDNRQRMLHRYHTECVLPSSQYDSSYTCSSDFLSPSKDSSEDHHIPDLPTSMSLPRAKVATVQRHPTSTMFNSRNSLEPPSEYLEHSSERPASAYYQDFRYNVPLEERFHQQKITRVQDL